EGSLPVGVPVRLATPGPCGPTVTVVLARIARCEPPLVKVFVWNTMIVGDVSADGPGAEWLCAPGSGPASGPDSGPVWAPGAGDDSGGAALGGGGSTPSQRALFRRWLCWAGE